MNGIWDVHLVDTFVSELEDALRTIKARYRVQNPGMLYDSRCFPVQPAMVAAAMEVASKRPVISECPTAIVISGALQGLQARRVVDRVRTTNCMESAIAWLISRSVTADAF